MPRNSDIIPFSGWVCLTHAFRDTRVFRHSGDRGDAGGGVMALDVARFRKLVALAEDDPLSRFALGQALFREGGIEALHEAAEHLLFANEKAPTHLATYHVLGQVLIKLGRKSEARRVLTEGCEKVGGVGDGMGRDLGPAMAELLGML